MQINFNKLTYISIVYNIGYEIIADMISEYYNNTSYLGTIFSIGVKNIDVYKSNYTKSVYYDISDFGEVRLSQSTIDNYSEVWSTNINVSYFDNIVYKPLRYISKQHNLHNQDIDCGFFGYIDSYESPSVEHFMEDYQIANPCYVNEFTLKMINTTDDSALNIELSNCKFVLSLPKSKENSQDILSIYKAICYGYHVLSKKSDINYFPGLVTEWETIDELNELMHTVEPQDFSEKYKNMTCNEDDYNNYIEITKLKLKEYMNSKNITICAIAKNEYNYIKEWVKYHLAIGFDKIVVYDNNDIDGERYDELLKEYIDNGTVEIRDRRGQTGQQLIVYNEYYQNDNFSWVCFLDLDEYISFGENSGFTNVNDFISQYDKADSIGLYWKCYGDNGYIFNNGQCLLDRFTEPMPIDICNPKQIRRLNCWSKTFYRKGLNIEVCEHFAVKGFEGFKSIDVTGDAFSQIPSNEKLLKCYDIAYVKHFMTKTVDEWFHCKLNRGHAGVVGGGVTQEYLEKYNTSSWSYGFDSFFNFNTLTEDKVKYLKSHGYVPKIEFKPNVLICVHIQNQYHYDMILKYYNIINNVCNARWLFVPNGLTYYLQESPGFPYSDYYHSGDNFDLQGLIGLSNNVYQFSNDFHCFINIGYPLSEDGNNLDEYYKTLDDLFGDEHKVRIWLQKTIENNCAVISSHEQGITSEIIRNCPNIIDVANQFLPMTDGKISDNYIKYNTFISSYGPILYKIIIQPLWMKIETKYIQDNLHNNTLCEYQAFQLVYPAIFDNLIII